MTTPIQIGNDKAAWAAWAIRQLYQRIVTLEEQILFLRAEALCRSLEKDRKTKISNTDRSA